jgi:sigma-B regulation protein RsbU (phosphoserine phosphatase)
MKVKLVHSLATKMSLLVLLGTGLTFLTILAVSHFYYRKTIVNDLEKGGVNLARTVAGEIDGDLRAVAEITETLALFLEVVHIDRHSLKSMIRRVVESQEEIFGTTVAYAPYRFMPDVKAFSPCYHVTDHGLEFVQLADPPYDYLDKPWYRIPKESGKPVWSKPHFGKGGDNTAMITYSYPFYEINSDGKARIFKGVVAGNISIPWLTKKLSSIKVERTGYCFLVSSDGTFLAGPQKAWVMKESLFSISERAGKEALRGLRKAMLDKESGIVDVGKALSDTPAFVTFARVSNANWSLGLLIPKVELFKELQEQHRINIVLAVAGVTLMLIVSLVASRSSMAPLRRMVGATSQIANGNLDIDLPHVRSKSEVGQLAESFNRMTQDLKKHIKDLTESTAARERIESELAVAARIQTRMLPRSVPAFPGHSEFRIHGTMQPAKEVGGDFYEFFLIDHDRLCFAIGDVADKGIPAALFMTVTIYLLRMTARTGLSPSEILESLNQELSRDNDACMFVSVFCGFLNVRSGELLYANGGHDPPFLLQASGQVSPLADPGGPVLGLDRTAVFRTDKLIVQPGDMVFAYTDGVTERFNESWEPFSSDRLRANLVGVSWEGPEQLINHVSELLEDFSGAAPRSDDTTMLAISYDGTDRT